jgi:hypothetical protein
MEAASVVEEEDHEDGEATKAVECGVSLGFWGRQAISVGW